MKKRDGRRKEGEQLAESFVSPGVPVSVRRLGMLAGPRESTPHGLIEKMGLGVGEGHYWL